MRKIPKIVDMQNSSMHNDGSRSNLDSLWTGMQIDTFIQINALTKLDMVRKPQADMAFNCRQTIHVEDETIKQPSQPNSNNGRDPCTQKVQKLFENIPKEGRRLAVQIETNAI